MIKWEYKILQISSHAIDELVAMLDELGADGWEVISPVILPLPTYNMLAVLLLKRPVEEAQQGLGPPKGNPDLAVAVEGGIPEASKRNPSRAGYNPPPEGPRPEPPPRPPTRAKHLP